MACADTAAQAARLGGAPVAAPSGGTATWASCEVGITFSLWEARVLCVLFAVRATAEKAGIPHRCGPSVQHCAPKRQLFRQFASEGPASCTARRSHNCEASHALTQRIRDCTCGYISAGCMSCGGRRQADLTGGAQPTSHFRCACRAGYAGHRPREPHARPHGPRLQHVPQKSWRAPRHTRRMPRKPDGRRPGGY